MARCVYNPTTKRIFDSIRRSKDVATIQNLLQIGVDIDAKDSKGRTSLLLACFYRRKQIVDLLIKKGANADGKCRRGEYTVLHYAARYGWTKIVRCLVNKVSDLNARDVNGETPMHHASRSGRLRIMKCLVKKGADIDCKNLKGITPLLYAAQNIFKSVFDLLINSKVNIDDNNRLLLYYASRNKWTDAVQFLVARVPNLNERYMVKDMGLDAESSGKHLELVKCLVGPWVEGTDVNKETEMIIQAALLYASYMGHLQVVKWLVTRGSDMKRVTDLNTREINGSTALHFASYHEHTEIAKYLVEQGADMNIRDCKLGNTALHTFAHLGQLEMVKYLVGKGADIEVKNNLTCTPFMSAAIAEHKDVVDLLISSGANVVSLNIILLHLIASNGWTDIAQLLLKKGWDLDAMNKSEWTSLAVACFYQQFETAKFLLQAGARWDTVDSDGTSPLNHITTQEQPNVKFIKLLIGHGAYLKPVDYYALVKSSSLQVLQDAKFCCQTIINRFNNHDLYELYKLPASEGLPLIEKMKIMSGSEVAQAIERNAEFEIHTKGYCNILEVSPMALSIFSVKSVLRYYKEKASILKNGLKRTTTFDSVNNDQPYNKLMRLS